jgi:hypothetical protein
MKHNCILNTKILYNERDHYDSEQIHSKNEFYIDERDDGQLMLMLEGDDPHYGDNRYINYCPICGHKGKIQ